MALTILICSFGLRSRVDSLIEANVSEKHAVTIFRPEVAG
jgi:hypothetical protein